MSKRNTAERHGNGVGCCTSGNMLYVNLHQVGHGFVESQRLAGPGPGCACQAVSVQDLHEFFNF